MSSDEAVVRRLERARFIAALLAVSGVFLTSPARAHFNLQAPPSWAMQNSTGDPQKSAPCGQADPGTAAQPTGTVTAFAPGQTITITINETVFHPGHYRVALAKTRAELPADPAVTAGTTACGSTVIEANPVLPLLADGQLLHTSKMTGAQSFQVTLPSNFTCEKCTLQVAEFMSNHGLNNPGGCFYHHCADISIGAGGASGTGGAGGGAGKSGTGGASGGAGGTNGGTSSNGGTSGGGGTTSGGAATMGGTASGGTSTMGGAASGGTSAGGTTGAGGATSTGGATSAGGANTAGANSGNPIIRGGASAGGAGGAAPIDEGCGCSVPGRRGMAPPLAVGLLLLSAVLGARRRRRRRSSLG